ncbi:hypothetical protein B0T26DRAFT_190617 [Lasiosphaeria miniovina]|uniref:Rhodopsin domain-containing protein n=1 Tax=Lasiosphaeria miniovina TaxID=1954250 RepID=A0AA40ATF2_9PEZI|nr:uncharacterized protein B0T26DRAFT_190617 [Lasiosphaeria miniovina]KAK0721674.1 hypothetical protein B0T26DRAFT_190617 [Lasiosphaeria miniovina]
MEAFVTEAFALLGIGLLMIGLRSYVRITTVGFKGLQADDYLMFLAAVVYSIETALAYSVGAYWKGLANNAMADEQRRLLDPASEEYRLRVNGSKTQVAGWSTYTLLLWTLKAAMCTFYLRLTEGLEFRNRIYIGFGLIVSTWLAVLFSILFGCHPLEKNWQIYPDPGNFCQPAISKIDIFVTVVLNVLTDLYLMSIPIPMLWRSSMKPLRKAGLILLFSGGAFVTMAGILRCVLIITDPVNGAQQAGSWAVRETFVAVVTSNLPMVFPLINRWGRPLIGSLRSFSSKAGKLSGLSRSGDPQSGAFRLQDNHQRRGPRSVNPITDFTFNDSEERIIDHQSELREPGQKQAAIETETNLEAGTARRSVGIGPGLGAGAGSGGILKETSLQVTEMRKSRSDFSTDDRDIGDYYLVQQSRKSSEAQPRPKTHKKVKHSSHSFSLGKRS